jgi:acid phosphatase
VVVALENHSYETVVGSSSAPYLNNTLIARYGLATNFYANGHDSLSQYWWMLDGTNNCDGNVNDCKSNPTTLVATADSIIREVINHGQTWKQYTESLPSRGFITEEPDGIPGSPSGTYYSRHAPAIYLSDVRQGTPTNQAVDCTGAPNGYDSTKQACNVVNFADANAGFSHDVSATALPNFSLVIPNGCDDAHDCSFSSTDSWLQTNIGALLNSSYFQAGGDGLLILWFDEGSLSGFTAACGTTAHADNRLNSTTCSGGGGRIAVVVAAPDLTAANFKSSVYFQHPSVTKSVCEALGIPTPSPAASAADFSGFF